MDRTGNEAFVTTDKYPDAMQKKITLLKYFRNYMNQHLLRVSDIGMFLLSCNLIFSWLVGLLVKTLELFKWLCHSVHSCVQISNL